MIYCLVESKYFKGVGVKPTLFDWKRGVFLQGKVLCKRVSEMIEQKANELSVYVWDVEFEKEGPIYVLTIYIDALEGINIEQCEAISRYVDPLLDDKEFDSLPSYTLCVSSAGAERKLTKPEHFEICLDKKVLIKFYKAIDGLKQIEGILSNYTTDTITILADKEDKTYNMTDVSNVRLTIEI